MTRGVRTTAWRARTSTFSRQMSLVAGPARSTSAPLARGLLRAPAQKTQSWGTFERRCQPRTLHRECAGSPRPEHAEARSTHGEIMMPLLRPTAGCSIAPPRLAGSAPTVPLLPWIRSLPTRPPVWVRGCCTWRRPPGTRLGARPLDRSRPASSGSLDTGKPRPAARCGPMAGGVTTDGRGSRPCPASGCRTPCVRMSRGSGAPLTVTTPTRWSHREGPEVRMCAAPAHMSEPPKAMHGRPARLARQQLVRLQALDASRTASCAVVRDRQARHVVA